MTFIDNSFLDMIPKAQETATTTKKISWISSNLKLSYVKGHH